MANIMETMKSHFENFLPVWEWKIHSIEKKELKRKYQMINQVSKTLQYVLAVVAILVAVSFERSRQMVTTAVFRKGLPTFLLDVFTYVILAYLLGLKRFPVNYISFVIIRTCIVLEEIVKPERNNYVVNQRTVGKSRSNGIWTMITISSKPETTSKILTSGPSFFQSLGIVILCLVGYWVASRLTKIDVSKYKEAALISQIISTSVAVMLVLSTYAFDVLPDEFKEIHKKYCKRWIIFTAGVSIFTVAFVFERLQFAATNGRRRAYFNFIDWEAFITLVVFSFMIRYLPRIHKDMTLMNIFANKEEILLETVLPTSLMNAVVSFGTDKYGIRKTIYKLFME